MKRSHFITALIIATSISSFVALFQHHSSPLRCSLDGVLIDPLYEVTIIRKDNTPTNFSCILSARIWLIENSEPLSSIWVTDEATGKKIRAELAYYVESDVITTPHTGDKIHAFAQETAANLHAQRFAGKFVKNPFRVPRKRPVKLVECAPFSPGGACTLAPSTQKPLWLVMDNVLIPSPASYSIFQGYFGQLYKGYSSPLEKPPKNYS